jgi:hypothetical protein
MSKQACKCGHAIEVQRAVSGRAQVNANGTLWKITETKVRVRPDGVEEYQLHYTCKTCRQKLTVDSIRYPT